MNTVVYKNKSPAKAQQGKDDLIISNPPSMIEIGNQSNNSKDTNPINISKQHDEVATSHYNILRSLPGYMVGDAIRNEDKTLCGSKEATAFAMANLQRNDCVFILRSDGSFTYASYQGRARDEPLLLLFQVDTRGHFKVLKIDQWPDLIKVPTHAAPFAESSMDKYPRHNAKVLKKEVSFGDDTPSLTESRPLNSSQGWMHASFKTIKPKKFSLGDGIPDKYVPQSSLSESQLAYIASKLEINDTAFVKRSGNSWVYSRVKSKDVSSTTFLINDNGDNMAVDVRSIGRCVRVLNEEILSSVIEVSRFELDSSFYTTFSSSSLPAIKSRRQAMLSKKNITVAVTQVECQSENGKTRSEMKGPTPPPLQMNTDVNATLSVPQVQCKTKDGGTIPVPMYKVGMDVYYKRNDVELSAKILEDHLDDITVRTGTGTRRRSSRLSLEGGGGNGTANASWDAMTPPSPARPPNSIETSTHPSSIVPDNNQVAVLQVQCKTEDGGIKMVPMYKVGMDVYYKRNDNVESAKILEVHLDDFLEPYYTIELEDGREKQTDNAHLTVER